MVNVEKFKGRLIHSIGQKRYEHSIRVMETAYRLAKKYNVDIEKAEKAAFFHDCAKYQDKEETERKIHKYKFFINEELKKSPQILHAYLGAIVAKEEYNIIDKDVLKAIETHTTADEDMTPLQKIIYIADLIEPSRKFDKVEVIREEAFKDLDKALLMSLDGTIEYLIGQGQYIAIKTLKARNFLILEKQK